MGGFLAGVLASACGVFAWVDPGGVAQCGVSPRWIPSSHAYGETIGRCGRGDI
jgi:hypothetical protein